MPKTAPDHWHASAVAAAEEGGRLIWSQQDLQQLRVQLREMHAIPRRVSLEELIAVLTNSGRLRNMELMPTTIPRTGTEDSRPARQSIRRFLWGDVPAFDVALSLRPRSYLSHGSAMLLNGLTSATELPLYVNREQSPKPVPIGPLEQSAIDRSFQNRVRVSRYVFRYEGTNIVLLSGKSTGDFGVADVAATTGKPYRATTLERTLVDITVRAVYAGGPIAVLEAYRRALTLREPARLVAQLILTLEVLGHVYPYHQAVGFYLERAGAAPADVAPLRERRLNYDFYLDYQMESPAHDPHWRMHYPSDLDAQ